MSNCYIYTASREGKRDAQIFFQSNHAMDLVRRKGLRVRFSDSKKLIKFVYLPLKVILHVIDKNP